MKRMTGGNEFFADANVLLYSIDSSNYRTPQLAGAPRVLRELGAQDEVDVRPALELVQGYVQWHPVETSAGLIERAWHWMDHAQVSYWDGLIAAAAERAGCDVLLTEDLQPGRRFGTVQVVNPFRQ